MDRTPRSVNGLSLTNTLKVNVSVAVSQFRPRLPCVHMVVSLRSKSSMSFA